MHVVVAGGSGFIGGILVARLIRLGHEVTVLSRSEPHALGPGCRWIRCDLANESPAAPRLQGADCLINLVGIKCERGRNTFEAAHVAAVHRLVDTCRQAGIRRFIHVSVASASRDPRDPYRDSKARGEEVVAESGLSWLVVRPGIVYGPGDDFMANVVDMVCAAPLVPVPGGGRGLLQIVDVEDVVDALLAASERPVVGHVDVVGPERLSFRHIIQRVARVLGLPTLVVSTPSAIQRLAAHGFERLPGNPLVTRAQIAMLMRGVVGDPEPARERLGIEPRALTDDRIRSLATEVRRRLPTIRLKMPATFTAPESDPRTLPRLWPLLATVLIAMWVLPSFLPSLWWRMAAINLSAAAIALVLIPLPWKRLWRIRAEHVFVGIGAAALLYGLGGLTHATITAAWPEATGQVELFRSFAVALPIRLALPLLLVIVVAEDCFWRGAVTLSLADRLGPWRGTLAGAILFAIAHVTSGPPMLWVAALLAGWFWNVLALRMRSLVAASVAHALWDVAVLWALPY